MYSVLTHIDLFSGIGGFALAADWAFPGIEHVFVDNDSFCQAILKKHWPNAPIYGDIRTLTTNAERQRQLQSQRVKPQERGRTGDSIKILTGGFPCQPFSVAGRRQGTADDRYLWPEMFRVIREFKPQWVIAENVAGLVTWNDGMVLEQVCLDLEAEGYETQSFIIPAVAVNAPHRRDRVWIVANAQHQSARNEGQRRAEQGASTRVARPNKEWNQHWLEVAAKLCTLDDGLPNGLARPRGWRNAALKGAGNAIVPQVAYEIMKRMSL